MQEGFFTLNCEKYKNIWTNAIAALILLSYD